MLSRAQGPVDGPGRDRFLLAVTVAAALLAPAAFGYMAWLRPSQDRLWGDEGTYLAMTASLVRDGDLVFGEADRDWALERGAIADEARLEEPPAEPKGVTVILQRTGSGITYSKPLLYPLLAAPPFRLLGEPGLLAVNAAALAVGALFAALYLGRLGRGAHRWLTLVTFLGCSATLPYLAWRMGEALQVGLALCGLVLACGALRSPPSRRQRSRPDLLDHPAAPWLGGALLGLLAAMRASNGLLLAGVLAGCLTARAARRSLAVVGGAAIALAVALAVSLVALGTVSPYTAERASFNARIGYPVGPGAAEALAVFDKKPASHSPHLEVSRAQLYSALYFFVGRHTGLLAYFPLALAMIGLLVLRPSRLGLAMLAAALAMATFYLLYTPHNYFGGSTFIGNRYFLVAYPALLIGLRELPPARVLIAVLAVGVLFGASAVASVRRTRDLDGTSQSHAAAGAFRRLPYETTAREIQGQRYRFWSGDYLRFTDAYATVHRRRLLLHSDRPHSELMLARSSVPRQTFFLVRPADAAAQVVFRDATQLAWRRPAVDPQRPGVVSIATERTWRQHPLGWSSRSVYDLRLLELRLGRGSGPARQVEVYYLGGDARALDAFSPQIVSLDVPAEGHAGRRGIVRLEIRNASRVVWSPDDVLPISIGHRLRSGSSEVARSQRPIDRVVGPGASASFEVEIEWPDEPGEYELALHLALHPIDEQEIEAGTVVVRPAPGETGTGATGTGRGQIEGPM
jgi:hypothetical protein